MGEINLDAARAAREEAKAERSFVFGGERFELPAEFPYEALGAMARLATNERDLTALRDVLISILGEEAHARFEELGASLPDMDHLVGELMVEYGLQKRAAGESGDGAAPAAVGNSHTS